MFTLYGAALQRACYLRRQCPASLTNHYCSIHTTDRKPIRCRRRDSALPAPLLGLRSRSGQHNNFMVLLLADKNLFKVIGASLVPAPLRPDASSPAHPTQIRPSSSLIFTSPSFYWSPVFLPPCGCIPLLKEPRWPMLCFCSSAERQWVLPPPKVV